MRPIFTVHAGEYLVGSEIESRFDHYRVWVPSKDDGIDLLVTDKQCKKRASIQVKLSKDHLATGKQLVATSAIKSGGWWRFDRVKLTSSSADFWVLVLCNLSNRSYDYVVIQPELLAERYKKISADGKVIQSYFWVTKDGQCFETRGLTKSDLAAICAGTYKNRDRDFTKYLNNWEQI